LIDGDYLDFTGTFTSDAAEDVSIITTAIFGTDGNLSDPAELIYINGYLVNGTE